LETEFERLITEGTDRQLMLTDGRHSSAGSIGEGSISSISWDRMPAMTDCLSVPSDLTSNDITSDCDSDMSSVITRQNMSKHVKTVGQRRRI
jgi:hypothetical protein